MSTQTRPSRAHRRASHSGRFPLPRPRLLLALLSLALLAAMFTRSASWPAPAPPSHSPERTNCDACHGSHTDGNEEDDPGEDEGLADIQTAGMDMAAGTGRVEGYASATSVPQGASIDFHVSANPGVTTYDLLVFPAGTDPPQPILTIPDLPGHSYSCGPVAALAGQEHLDLGCDWPVAYTLHVPPDWPSGLYVAAMLDQDDQLHAGRYASYIPFIVTEDQPGSTSDILFQFSTGTWQAYNSYGGWSLYEPDRAHRVTFDRPYNNCKIGNAASSTCRFRWEIPLASWLESEGYAVEYASNEDVHADPSLLANYNLLLSVGHDEYWSKEIRDHIDAFIDAGGNVAIFSGNTAYRQTRYQEGVRTLVCYKHKDRMLDPLYGVDNIRVTTRFGAHPVLWPQNSTTGLGYLTAGYVNVDGTGTVGQYTVYRSGHWVYQNTGLQDGDRFRYELEKRIEVDGALFTWQNGLPVPTGENDTPANLTILGLQQSTLGHATMAIYTRDGGGTVFNAATMGWPRGLWPSNNPQDYQVVRQITRNVVETLSSTDGPTNRSPWVDAGLDQTVSIDNGAALDGTIRDDGLPNPPGTVSVAWSQVSGPGTATFGDASAEDTTVHFSAVGAYVLRLTADDGALAASDEVTVTVQEGGGTTIVEMRISASSDDAEEFPAGYVHRTSTDLELIDDGKVQTVGLRFVGVAVPQGATIVDAYVQFRADEASSEATSLLVEGEATDDALSFASVRQNVTSRARTGASVVWTPAPWTAAGPAGPDQRTPDLARVIQEIASRPGWSAGNALALIFSGSGRRIAKSYEGDPSGAPLLHVEYTMGPPVNRAPAVDAGANQAVVVTDSATLDGTVSDDGLPNPPGVVTVAWSQVSGPSPATFGDVNVTDTTASFLEVGEYVLRLTASDGELTAQDEVTITVQAEPANQPPIVDAGPDRTVVLANVAVLDGTVSDDGLPNPPGAVTLAWSQVSGPSAATFADASAEDTTATLPTAGQYVLRLTAHDGELTTSDQVTLTVQESGGTTIVEVRVSESSDDVEEFPSGYVHRTSPDLELIDDGRVQTIGLRFAGLNVPPGATIVNAYVQFQADEKSSLATALLVEGQAADDAAPFAKAKWSVTSRSRTSAQIAWALQDWTLLGEAGPDQRTPDIAQIVQEVIDRPGWSAGNALALIFSGSGRRVAESYEGDPSGAPLLHVEYAGGP